MTTATSHISPKPPVCGNGAAYFARPAHQDAGMTTAASHTSPSPPIWRNGAAYIARRDGNYVVMPRAKLTTPPSPSPVPPTDGRRYMAQRWVRHVDDGSVLLNRARPPPIASAVGWGVNASLKRQTDWRPNRASMAERPHKVTCFLPNRRRSSAKRINQ